MAFQGPESRDLVLFLDFLFVISSCFVVKDGWFFILGRWEEFVKLLIYSRHN